MKRLPVKVEVQAWAQDRFRNFRFPTGVRPVTDVPREGGVSLARWTEPSGTGRTERDVVVRYEQLPALITQLAGMLDAHLQRERDAGQAEAG